MINRELSKIFFEMSGYLRMQNVAFKPQAYLKAARALENLRESAAEIYQKGGLKSLEEIEGVGESIASKMEEYIKTGKIKAYQELKRSLPIDLSQLSSVEGLGPRRAKLIYQKLGVRTIRDLEKAAKENKIAPLPGFGEKTQKNILENTIFLKADTGRMLLGEAAYPAEKIFNEIKRLKYVKSASIAGSYRRRKETIGDIDIVAAGNHPDKIIEFFISRPYVVKIWGAGPTKASVRMQEGFNADLRIVPEESYGAALQYFTGSKEHNVALRKIAISKGCKLNEYGLFKKGRKIAGRSEEEIYQKLGLQWVAPELRENQGEIESASEQKLPLLVEIKDIKGDLHCHSNWDGGKNSIEEMAQEAKKKGYEYIGISDHTKFLKIERGLDEAQIRKRNKEIDKINAQNTGFKILKGCEANILNDGSLDLADEALAELDYVIAGVHSSLKMESSQITERVIKALKNPNVDIISHPTGRIIRRRDESQIDLEALFKAARDLKKVLEINAYPDRLDLKDINIRRAKSSGIKMVINTDAHAKEQLEFMEFGVSQARRGWAEKNDILNTESAENLLNFFKNEKQR